MTCEISIAGFGGQGVLFLGKLLAFAGLYSGYEVSWMPSYGPEMRGGTANCSVIISDQPIGSPLISTPKILIAMNNPSFRKFEGSVAPGGTILANSSMVNERSSRGDVECCYVPATELAIQNGIEKSGNIILAGCVIKRLPFLREDAIEAALKKCTPAGKPALLEAGKKALRIGRDLDG
ncbi:MAG: 2-oxoacid:acceptor oxidoreductase family protein [Oscillospiraceae bacterium]|nr:2-oxoacid:acceptor oxidoreductase family protein [Oscillospiraceae bacterium]